MKKVKYILAYAVMAAGMLLAPAFSSAQLLNKGQSNNPFPLPNSGNYTNPTPADPFSVGQNWKGSTNTGTTSGQSNSGSNNSCKMHTSGCQNSTCKVKVNSSGRIIEECPAKSVRRNDIDANCMKQQNKQSGNCLDTVPVASVSRVAENTCARMKNKGWGSRKNPNHYGMDYASSQGTKVTAAADGRVVWGCKPMSGAGRVVCMEHEKKCQCTVGNPGGKCHEKYVTCYLHLKNCDPAKSKSTFKKGETLGAVGGSNYSGGTLYDYPGPKSYGPHLHFEIYSGAWGKGGYMSLKQDLINPQCDDIQTFCGNTGCYDVAKCGGKPTQYTGDSGDTMYEGGDSGATGSSGSSSSSGEAQNALNDCNLNQYIPEPDDCTFCPIFRVIFNAGSTVAIKAYQALAKSVANVVIVAFAIWLGVVVLRHISSMEVKDPRKMIQEILLQAFRVLIVWLILQGSFFQVMNLTLSPVFNTGLKYTQQLTGVRECSDSATFLEGLKGYDDQSAAGYNPAAEGGLPKSMGKNILCTIKSIEDSTSIISAYGRQAICLSFHETYAFLGFIPHFPLLVTGVFIYLTGLLLLVAFPWCLVDCVLNMCIAAGLAPAAIGAWAFKVTSSYLKKIWDFFMNAMFNFVFLGIVIYIIVVIVQKFMAESGLGPDKEDVNMFFDPINGLAYWGVKALQLFAICLLGWVFLDQGKKFAKSFANASGVNVGRSVGGTFAQGAKRLGLTSGKIGQKLGGGLYKAGKERLGDPARKLMNKWRIGRTSKKGTAFYDDKGNIAGYERTRSNLFTGFKKVTSRVDIDADGNKTFSRERQKRKAGLHARAVEWMNKRRLNKLLTQGQEFIDENGNMGYMMTWKRFGREITLKATLDENLEYQLSKDKTSLRMRALAKMTKDGSKLNKFAQNNMNAVHRNLTPNIRQETNVVKSDPMVDIQQKKDKTGKIIEEKIVFKTRLIKHIINVDGTINIKNLEKIVAETNLDKATIYRALAVEVLNRRGIALDEKFASRQASFLSNGVLALRQVNENGTITELAMGMAGPNADQMITDIKVSTANGSYSRTVDNGIMRKTVNYNNQAQQASVSYRFANVYYQQNDNGTPLNSLGKFAAYVDQNAAMAGFEQADLLNHIHQLKTGKTVNIDPARGGIQNSVFKAVGIKNDFQPLTEQRSAEEKLVDEIIKNELVTEEVRNSVLDMAVEKEKERVGKETPAVQPTQGEPAANDDSKQAGASVGAAPATAGSGPARGEFRSEAQTQTEQNTQTSDQQDSEHLSDQDKNSSANDREEQKRKKDERRKREETERREREETERREREETERREREEVERREREETERREREETERREREETERREREETERREREETERREREETERREREEAERREREETERREREETERREREETERREREEAERREREEAERREREEAERREREETERREREETEHREREETERREREEAERLEREETERREREESERLEREESERLEREESERLEREEAEGLEQQASEQRDIEDNERANREEAEILIEEDSLNLDELEAEQRRAEEAEYTARQEAERLETEAKAARERENIERKAAEAEEIRRREESERKKAEWEATLEKGRERRNSRSQEGKPERKIERPDSLGGMTKKRKRKRRNK